MKQTYTIEEIRAKVRSGQYGAEHMLRHLLALYDVVQAERDDAQSKARKWQGWAAFYRDGWAKSGQEMQAERDEARVDAVRLADFADVLTIQRDEARQAARSLVDRVAVLEKTLRHTSRLLDKAEAALTRTGGGVGSW